MNTPSYIRITPNDNVIVTLKAVSEGEEISVEGKEIVVRADIPAGHKVAVSEIAEGEDVIKYGLPIGHATADVQPGDWMHVKNVKTNLSGTLKYSYKPSIRQPAALDERTFEGYVREGGEVGVRNEIWIIPTVGCVNTIAETLARDFNASAPGGIDGCFSFSHPFGCSQLGEDHKNTQKILAGLVNHPNTAGVLIVGLGCENNTMDSFLEVVGEQPEGRVKSVIVQEVGDEFEQGQKLLKELADYASQFKRETVPVSKLKVGLKCGGSDGFSGITANPCVGEFSDRLIARGGSAVLTEVPEMFGAETLLMNRCESEAVFNDCVNMINGFKEYFTSHNQVVYENPSPGNKDGGITTLEDKSLGCTQKGGTAPVVDVQPYGGKITKPGLSLLNGPGNDIVAVTALAAAGCQIVLFTTGRGTPLGSPVPTVKISTNSRLAEQKKHWIDFNAGMLLEGHSMDETADALFELVNEIASGQKKTCSEERGFREIAIFKDGVTL